jgi:hypothetical protein
MQLRKRHHHMDAVSGALLEHAVPAFDVGYLRTRDVDAGGTGERRAKGGEGLRQAQNSQAQANRLK